MPSEFQLIEAFTRATGAAPRPPLGPGDDAAVLPPWPGSACVTVDAVVEGVHFRRATSSLGDVGHKALAVNLSDVAAMGARPRWCLVGLGVPTGFRLAEARELGRGLGTLARATGVAVAGGNVTGMPLLTLTVTVGGECPPEKPLLRSGARVGDEVWVSGTLGDARLGLVLLEDRGSSLARRLRQRGRLSRLAVRRQRHPTPRLELGRALLGLATSCIDVSDGLAQDASHLAQASGLQLCLRLGDLPVSQALRVAEPEDAARSRFAATGGEDYELLFTAPERARRSLARLARRLRLPLTCIGTAAWGSGVVLVDSTGRKAQALGGFDHLAARKRAGARRTSRRQR